MSHAHVVEIEPTEPDSDGKTHARYRSEGRCPLPDEDCQRWQDEVTPCE